jgi:hypothetical protein
MKNNNTLVFSKEDFGNLIKVGAEEMLANIFENREYRENVLSRMDEHNKNTCGGMLFVLPYYHLCCQEYVFHGRKGLKQIVEGKIKFDLYPLIDMKCINRIYNDKHDKYCDYEDNM